MKDFLEGLLRKMRAHVLSDDHERAHTDADTLLTLLCLTLANEAFDQQLPQEEQSLQLRALVLDIIQEYKQGYKKWWCG